MAAQSEREFEAFQSFVLGTKLFWTTELFAELKRAYQQNLEAAGAQAGEPGPARVERLLKDETIDGYFGWFERHLQRMKYSGHYGLVPFHESRREALRTEIDRPVPDGLLSVDADFEMPAYYEAVDVHQHPGGVWSDELAGLVYERGARSTTPLLSADKDLHYRFADLIQSRSPAPKRILDMGCGFGKTTKPLYEVNRDADVVGVDLSAPCLRIAAQNAAEGQARNVRFLQRDAAETGLEAETFGVVTSTMLLHEMPVKHVNAVFEEAHRLLEPGGTMIHLDFLPPDDEFLHYLHLGHSRRNNEPWMKTLAEMGVAGAMEKAGFCDISITPFEESPGALAEAGQKWRFPWTVISATKAA
ncbi:MAG: class I SAM-dependent methyltransferase [Pseudorhodoplanes sp.]